MAIVLGLAAALTYGAADFVGGLVSRRASVFQVVFLSQVAGTAAFLAVLLVLPGERSTWAALRWGFGAGVAGSLGVTLLYGGLARGRMSIVAPVTAVQASVLPVLFGLAVGERPGPLSLAGVALALAAVALISATPNPERSGVQHRKGVPEALAAGSAFGVFFIMLERAGDASGMWPLVGSRGASLLLLGGLVVVTGTPLRAPAGTARGIVLAGVLDVAANVFYLLATRQGLLSLVAVLTSLYPASTVLLARVVLDERLTSSQLAGLSAAAAGVVLIAAG